MNIISEVDMLCTKRFFVGVVYSFMAFVMTLGSGLGNFLVENIAEAAELALPASDQILNISNDFSYPILRGVKFNPQDPLNLEFVFDSHSKDIVNKEEANQLIEFFVAGLSIAEDDMWVNLSPYESERVIPEVLSNTALGRDMLAQDYFLKQLSSSLTSPNGEYGAEYWEKVLESKNISSVDVDAFNKIWIVPGEAQLQDAQTEAFIDFAQLDVMTERDYMAMDKNSAADKSVKTDALEKTILPVIKNEINNGKNFSRLRQIHYSLILASWFKKKFANTFYKDYFNSKTVEGIDINGKESKTKIYNQYVDAFKKGVYKIEKKERNAQGRIVKRQYMSGGVTEREVTQKTNVKNVPEVDKDFEGKGFMCSSIFLNLKNEINYAASVAHNKAREFYYTTTKDYKRLTSKLLENPGNFHLDEGLYWDMLKGDLSKLSSMESELKDIYEKAINNNEHKLRTYISYVSLRAGFDFVSLEDYVGFMMVYSPYGEYKEVKLSVDWLNKQEIDNFVQQALVRDIRSAPRNVRRYDNFYINLALEAGLLTDIESVVKYLAFYMSMSQSADLSQKTIELITNIKGSADYLANHPVLIKTFNNLYSSYTRWSGLNIRKALMNAGIDVSNYKDYYDYVDEIAELSSIDHTYYYANFDNEKFEIESFNLQLAIAKGEKLDSNIDITKFDLAKIKALLLLLSEEKVDTFVQNLDLGNIDISSWLNFISEDRNFLEELQDKASEKRYFASEGLFKDYVRSFKEDILTYVESNKYGLYDSRALIYAAAAKIHSPYSTISTNSDENMPVSVAESQRRSDAYAVASEIFEEYSANLSSSVVEELKEIYKDVVYDSNSIINKLLKDTENFEKLKKGAYHTFLKMSEDKIQKRAADLEVIYQNTSSQELKNLIAYLSLKGSMSFASPSDYVEFLLDNRTNKRVKALSLDFDWLKNHDIVNVAKDAISLDGKDFRQIEIDNALLRIAIGTGLLNYNEEFVLKFQNYFLDILEMDKGEKVIWETFKEFKAHNVAVHKFIYNRETVMNRYKSWYSSPSTRINALKLKTILSTLELGDENFKTVRDYVLDIVGTSGLNLNHLMNLLDIYKQSYYTNTSFDFEIWDSISALVENHASEEDISKVTSWHEKKHVFEGLMNFDYKVFVDLIYSLPENKLTILKTNIERSESDLKELIYAIESDRVFLDEMRGLVQSKPFDYYSYEYNNFEEYSARFAGPIIDHMRDSWGAAYRAEAVASNVRNFMFTNNPVKYEDTIGSSIPMDVGYSIRYSAANEVIRIVINEMWGVESNEIASQKKEDYPSHHAEEQMSFSSSVTTQDYANIDGGVSMKSLSLENVNTYKGPVASVNVSDLSSTYKISIADLQQI